MLSDDICPVEIPLMKVHFKCDQIQIHKGRMT